MTKNEKMMKKIRNLLELSENKGATEAEAKTALLKAQELMAKHDMQLADVVGQNDEDKVTTVSIEFDKGNGAGIKKLLCAVIANAYRCEVFLKHGFGANANKRYISFLGHKADAELAKLMFTYAYEFVIYEGVRLRNKAKKEGEDTKGIIIQYAEGFAVGIKKLFAKQEKALMIITPEDVKDAFTEIQKDSRRVKTTNRTQYNAEAFAKGVKDGENFTGKAALNKGKKKVQ